MKKFLAAALAGAMCLSLMAGCSNSSAPSNPSNPSNSSTPAASNPSAPAASAPSASGAAFKLGGIGPLTGGNAIYGNAVMNGAKIAVDEINALGGIQLEFNPQDDVSDAETSVNAYNNLKDWGMQALVGTASSTDVISG